MTYFSKNKSIEWSSIITSNVLPLIYKDSIQLKSCENRSKSWFDEEENILTDEVILTLYLASWRVSNLMIIDLIQDKLGYEKDYLKLTNQLFSDLGADSLDLVEIVLYLEKIVGIPVHEDIQFEHLTDLIDYVFSIMVTRIQKSTLGWPKDEPDFLIEW